MRAIKVLTFLLLTFFLICCSPGRNEATNDQNRSFTVDERRKQKPTFSDLTAEPYDIGVDEPTFIRVVTNSTHLQEVLMVYHNFDENKWEQISLGRGSGESNYLIGDFKFEKRYGFGQRNKDLPEFYMRYSVDEGRTWINHKIGRAHLHCIDGRGRQIKQRGAHLLVSLPLNTKNNLPDVAIVLQWNKHRSWKGKGDPAVEPKKLCGVLKELPLDWSAVR